MRSDLTIRSPSSAPAPQDGISSLDALRNLGAFDERDDRERIQWARHFAAVWRYKWLIAGLLTVGAVVSTMVAQRTKDEYEAQAANFLTNSAGRDGVRPVRTEGLLSPTGWMELPRSFAILDSVAYKLRLFVKPQRPEHKPLLADFAVEGSVVPAAYTLRTDSSGTRYTLYDRNQEPLEHGVVGDSIGRNLGFRWAPAQLGPRAEITFELQSLRHVALDLQRKLDVNHADGGSMLKLTLRGDDPKEVTRVLNGINQEFLAYADRLTKQRYSEIRRTIGEQLDVARQTLDNVASRYQNFKIATITHPTEATPVSGGVEETRMSVIEDYWMKQREYKDLRTDIARLEAAIEQARLDVTVSPNTFLAIASVNRYGSELQAAIAYQRRLVDSLSRERAVYTTAREQTAALEELIRQTTRDRVLPSAVALLAQLENHAAQDSVRLTKTEADLREIPRTTNQETLLRNSLETALQSHAMYTSEYQRAQMVEAAAIPDVSEAYGAQEPTAPSSVQAPRVFAMIMLVSLAIAVAIALLLDRTDKRFRYPDQATRDLGLAIIGAVPSLRRSKNWHKDPEIQAGMVEAFRSVRLALSHAVSQGEALTVAISSPGVGEGKSFVAGNLALAMAEGGYRTLLIDGDTRRGELHTEFNSERRPGFLDYLAGKTTLNLAIRKTEFDNLWLLPGGTRFRHGPELLMTSALQPTLTELRSRFDAIIVDTPPLSAGVDAFVLGTAVGNMVLVLRNGKTDRRMAEAKLQLLDRLPVRILGTVLNDFKQASVYEYYSYVDGYASESEDEEEPELEPPNSRRRSLASTKLD